MHSRGATCKSVAIDKIERLVDKVSSANKCSSSHCTLGNEYHDRRQSRRVRVDATSACFVAKYAARISVPISVMRSIIYALCPFRIFRHSFSGFFGIPFQDMI